MKVIAAIIFIGIAQWCFAVWFRLSGRGEPGCASIFKNVPQNDVQKKETKK